jgi:ribosomal-protein-alanine N-acetyltransferase
MTPELRLRQARLTDLTAIWTIEKLAFPSPWGLFAFVTELRNPFSTILVAGPPRPRRWQTWGYLIYWLVADEMHILNLAVHPRRRRQGVARALLAAGLDQARADGAACAWLEVRPSNLPAQKLYQASGFRQVGVRPRYYDDNQEDALLYSLCWEDAPGK